MENPSPAGHPTRAPEDWILMALLGVNLVSIFGYLTFVSHPDLLARFPWSLPIYAVSFRLFAILQIALAFLAMATCLARTLGWRWLPAFAAVFAISLSAELGGTGVGVPFGKYAYTELLGPKIMGRVPYLIPLSWFFMSLPSYWLAGRTLGRWTTRVRRIALGSLLLLTWDLTLDPAMSHLTPFWIWENAGTYYGMPFLNLVGWFLTGVLIMVAYDGLRIDAWLERVSPGFLVRFYGVNLLLPLAIVLAAGLWPAALLTLAVMGLVYALYRQARMPQIATA